MTIASAPPLSEALASVAGDDWEIAFIAITPRNLREDTQEVSEETKAAYQRVAGVAAPAGV